MESNFLWQTSRLMISFIQTKYQHSYHYVIGNGLGHQCPLRVNSMILKFSIYLKSFTGLNVESFQTTRWPVGGGLDYDSG